MLALLLALFTPGLAEHGDHYRCKDSNPIAVVLEGPHRSVELHSKSYPQFAREEDASGESKCHWKVSALHGGQVEVTVLEVEMADDCVSTSALRLEDQSGDSSFPLHYPGREARCNMESSIPSTCLTAEGELSITATPGLRFRLRVKAVLPLECPPNKPEDYCPQGPCCGIEDCSCQYLLGTEPLALGHNKTGNCHYSLVSSPGSQVSVNFLDMRLPSQGSNGVCEAWVQLEEPEDDHLGSLIGSQKFCGLTVPNYPGPSVIMSGSNSLTVNYFLPETSLSHGNGFEIEASAVNPLCAPHTYTHRSGEQVCEATCGDAFSPRYPKRPSCPFPDLPQPCLDPEDPECMEATTSAPCTSHPEKVLVLAVMQNFTDIFVEGAEVNVTSASSFFTYHSTKMGEVVTQGFPENTSLVISVSADKYMAQQQAFNLECQNIGCDNCEVRVTLEMDPVVTLPPTLQPPGPNETTPKPNFCQEPMSLSIDVSSNKDSPLNGVLVSVNYVGDNDESELVVADGLLTNEEGLLTIPVTENGNYKITLTKEGWQEQVVEALMEDCLHNTKKILLEKEPSACKPKLDVHVKNDMDQGVEGAEVSVFLPGQTEPLDFSPLVADVTGGVEQEMEEESTVHLKVAADGYFTKDVEVNVTCEPAVVVLQMDELPTTTTPDPETNSTLPDTCFTADKDPITLSVHLFDLLTGLPVVGANVDVKLEDSAGNIVTLVDKAILGADWSSVVVTNGLYHVAVNAEGYKLAERQIEVDCQVPDCICSSSLELALQQLPCEEQEEDNILRIEILDSSTKAVVPGATVTVQLETANGPRLVSPYGECPEQESLEGAQKCGIEGITAEECLAASCCWIPPEEQGWVDWLLGLREAEIEENAAEDTSIDSETGTTEAVPAETTTSISSVTPAATSTTDAVKPTTPKLPTSLNCYAKTSSSAMTTDPAGLVSMTLPGEGNYQVSVEREGFKPLTYNWPASECGCETKVLTLSLTQDPICEDEGLVFNLSLDDAETGLALPTATIHLILTSSALGASQVDVGGSLFTDLEGTVSPTLYTKGSYRVTASLPGYLDLSEEFEVQATACDLGSLNMTMSLTPTPADPQCTEDQNTGLDVVVSDMYTGNPISGALIDITYEGNTTALISERSLIADGVRTDQNGEARVPVSKLGMYSAQLNNKSLSDYGGEFQPADALVNLTCCSCKAELRMILEQPFYCEPSLNLTIVDNTTGLPIPSARVELLLVASLAGSSLTEQGPIVTTDAHGIAELTPNVNGNYSIKVIAENYLSREVAHTLACDNMDCEATCQIELEVDLQEKFCSERTMTMFVRDSTDNSPLEGATVNMVQETHRGPNDVGTFAVDANGEVSLPLIGNGHYTTTLSHPGFMNVTSAFRVAVTPDQCSLLAPMEMVPMSPPIKAGCVRVSLTWGAQPSDLDLYSYRVHQFQTEDTCLTYYCDGKDPCDGIDFDQDNMEGGDAGAETITYCNVDEFSHMIWVDDRSGEGASLLGSEATLHITDESGETQEVVLRAGEGQTDSRYWLAGCLTTSESSFDFLPLNQFTSGQPDLEQPMHCHSRAELSAGNVVPKAEVHVSVETTQGDPLSGVMVSLTTSHETYSRLTTEDGKLLLPVTEDGPYSLLAQLDSFVPERLNFSLYCEGVEGVCATSVQVTMMSHQEDGALRVKLNWARETGRDLDLHLVQVVEDDPTKVCTTYWNNMAGCKDTELDQNVGAGALLGRNGVSSSSLAETITVHNLAAKSKYRFMVFVDDNTATGADLGQVQPQITMTQGSVIVTDQMPQLPMWKDGSRFWLAGAIEVVGTSFRFVSANTWSEETPNNKPGITIDNLLTQTVDSTTESFCEGSRLSVTVNDALTNEALENVTATILRLDDGEEQVIAEAAFPDSNGELSVSLLAAGHYEVQVSGAGYVSSRKSIGVTCSPSDCSLCAPSIMVPLSPALGSDKLRLTLGGGQFVENLDIFTVFRDTSTACVTSPSGSQDVPCPGVERVTGTDGQGVETVTFKQPASSDTKHVYTVYVEWTAPIGNEEATFPDTNAWVSLTDGTITEEIHMEAKVYGGERRWLAGCLLLTGGADPTFQLRPLNVFFTEKPDEEMPDLCLETFGLAEKGPEWDGQCVKDHRSRILPVKFGKTDSNSPDYCINKCKSHEYSYAGVEYSKECYCGNTPPSEEDLTKESDCNRKCPGDSSKICGGSWKMNVYETGYESGLAMVPGRSCDCSYSLGGCKITSAPPVGFACECKYQGYWTCGAQLKKCTDDEDCPGHCTDKTCCRRGGGDCGGYWG